MFVGQQASTFQSQWRYPGRKRAPAHKGRTRHLPSTLTNFIFKWFLTRFEKLVSSLGVVTTPLENVERKATRNHGIRRTIFLAFTRINRRKFPHPRWTGSTQ